MIFKNLFRRKGRTLLTMMGVSIGVAAIIGLGTLATGLQDGYNAMLTGSQADLVLSQPNSFDISFSSVPEEVGQQLLAMPEVSAVSGMLEGFVQTDGIPIFFAFGYPEGSFVLDRFNIIAGESIFSREARGLRGKKLMLGASAAETLEKQPGDTLRLTDSVYRIVGIYETGDAFEDSGSVLAMPDAQDLLGKPRQVSLFYLQLEDPALRDRLEQRITRQFDDLSLSSTADFADKQLIGDVLQGYVWAIAGLAILIGGVGMMNAQLMSVYERTREIGVLRSVGWSRWRILLMILSEALVVCLAGGLMGVAMGWGSLRAFSGLAAFFGATPNQLDSGLLLQALIVVLTMGVIAGVYPAWRASQLQPVEALRYEGGSSGKGVRRLPVGGMAVQSLWQRSTRTLLTVGAIGLTVGAIMALEGIIRGTSQTMSDLAFGSDVEIMVRQSNIADTSLSAIDERIGERIAALPEVESASGFVFTAVLVPEANSGFFILQGYEPNGYAVRRFNVTEGNRLSSNHQIILGRTMAEALNKKVGETIDLGGSRFRIVGIFETGVGWEELGGVVSLRDGQAFAGRPHKVTMFAVKVRDPSQAPGLVEQINLRFPEVHAALAGEFVDQLPDMENADGMINAISVLTILVGGVGVLNTMLMAVFERTREIGVIRALGWRRRRVLGLILRESMLLGILGGVSGIGIALGLVEGIRLAPLIGDAVTAIWSLEVVTRAIAVAFFLGVIGGLYPAFRATRLQPVEALRYE
jgi:ABC-type antimicrobial peptide transport system permease subunit